MTNRRSMGEPMRIGLAVVAAAAVMAALSAPVLARDDAASIDILAPGNGDRVGVGGLGWFVDLAVEFDLPAKSLKATGFTAPQLTGPGVHNNVPPLPGTFAPGKDDRFPGLVVLLSTTTIGAGPGQNLANVFNLTGVTNLRSDRIELWDTWLIGSAAFGTKTKSKLFVAVVDDLNRDGIYNDAPDVVRDADGDGDVDAKDLTAVGLASDVRRVSFFIN